jgi:transcriptional regulator with GAF, ATPase, and Fis domain
MELYASLFEISKILLSEQDPEKMAATLLSRAVDSTQAEGGFVVVRDNGGYEQKLQSGYDRSRLSESEHRFSLSLVKQAIQTQQLIDVPNVLDDPRFSGQESVQELGRCAVLVAPLRSQGEVYGVVYLERRKVPEPFSADARRFLTEFADMAGLFIHRTLERQALERRNRSLEQDLFSQYDFKGIVTRHPNMLQLLKIVAQVADSDATVLIRGETGTGKELVARALHLNSSRRSKPFVTLHCTALPDTLLESELFGHVRGAYTGAQSARAGRIASADHGTLLLDEAGEIPPEVQAKLLRFLQFGELQRLGSDRVERVDVRILAATHEDLAELVRAGRFRQDLYFRLKVVELEIPPLRERRGDVPLLLDHFVRKYWRREGESPWWSQMAERSLRAYGYPGNVRELEHIVERACLLTSGPEMDVDLLPADVRSSLPTTSDPFEEFTNEELKRARRSAIDELERSFLTGLMQRCEGNVARGAEHAKMRRTYLYKLLARHRWS